METKQYTKVSLKVSFISGTLRNPYIGNNKPKFHCLECDKSYIGQTGRDFRVKLGQYKSRGLELSAVYQHAKNKNQLMDWNTAAILYHSDKEQNRLVIESTHINKNSTFNNTQGVVSIDS